MENINKKIGIIGGGQLGKMMVQEAKKMGFYITIIDPNKNCPASSIVDEHIIANFNDEKSIRLLASKSDIITYEFEHIGVEILEKLENEEIKIYPTSKNLKIIQNKFNQKLLLKKHNINISEFRKVNDINDIKEISNKFNYPFLLKCCTGGYDGKGNFIIKNKSEIEIAFETLGSGKIPLMAEKFFDFKKEISILICRDINGQIEVYPIAENIHSNNILIETKVPASLSYETKEKAINLAKKIMNILQGVGMFCIEMFVDYNDNIAVNEIAPRPHNSGHYTIEACMTSQFEQHIRAITGLPLGSTELFKPVIMKNLLGLEGYIGNTEITGINEALKIRGTYIHIYGKEKCEPKRKMGHLTVLSDTLKEAEEKSNQAFNFIKIKGNKKL